MGEIYLNFLQNIFGPILENVPFAVYRSLWFYHDGAPPHYHRHVRQYLDHIFIISSGLVEGPLMLGHPVVRT
jgi:hypothetical protein